MPRRPGRQLGSRARSGRPERTRARLLPCECAVGLAISRRRPRRRRRGPRLSAAPAIRSRALVPRRPDLRDSGRKMWSRELVRRRPQLSDRGCSMRSRASKTWSGHRRKLGRRIFAATPEDVGHAHGAGITRMAPRGPPPMDRAWRPQALVVALFGWLSDQRVKAARGPWADSSAPRMSLGRWASLGRASSSVHGEVLVVTACAIGLCRPRTSVYTRSLSGISSLWRRGSCQTSPCASRCRLLLMTTGS